MDRRTFLNYGLPLTGAIMVAPALLNAKVREELAGQFLGTYPEDGYDVVINGAGLAGYFAAMEASRKGLRALIIEKRSSPGFEIAAKKRLWIGSEGLELLDRELTELLFPEQEKQEVFRSGGSGPGDSLFDNELALFSGTVRKGMLRNLLIAKVHILLMTDVCGVFTAKDEIQGVMLACKQGLFSLPCRHFIDASDNLLFSRNLFGQNYQINRAGFVLELLQADSSAGSGVIRVPQSLGLLRNEVRMHRGKNANHQVFAEFEFPVKTGDVQSVEMQAREVCAKLGEALPSLDPAFQKARIHQYALECSLFLKNSTPPKYKLQHYSLLSSDTDALTVTKISAVRESAHKAIAAIKPGAHSRAGFKELRIPGANVPVRAVSFTDIDDPNLMVPLTRCSFDLRKYVKKVREAEVLVGGGGTSGIFAGIGAAERHIDTVVVDYFNDPGGSKTLGGVMGYYHGIKNHPLIRSVEEASGAYARKVNASGRMARQLYLLDRLTASGGNFIPDAIICGVINSGNKVEGLLLSSNGVLEIVRAAITVDGTGDGDLAAFAGAPYDHGNFRNGLTQNYSQWNVQGGGKPPSSITSDYGIIDNRFMSEIQRGLFVAHYEAHFYDFLPFLTVRESRRVKGMYELNITDVLEGTHFEDVVCMAASDFDPHYIGNSEYTRCGFLLPHSNVLPVEIPYRSLIPETLDGILITGKAFSQTQNALQYTRMSGDLTILGYITGQIAAETVRQKIQPRQFKVKALQEEWTAAGFLPADRMALSAGNKTTDRQDMLRRIEGLARGLQEYLPQCCYLPKEHALPLLKESFDNAQGEGKLLIAKALAWFGDSSGVELIQEDLQNLFRREQEQGYPEGYVENYDFIRGREKNILEGLFWKINQNIALLALSGSKAANPAIREILEKTTSGGEVITWTGSNAGYLNGRTDLRLIPFHNRIYNLCFYAERNPDRMFIADLEKLLGDVHVADKLCPDYSETRRKLYGADLELYVGAALARCGGEEGYHVLVEYLGDIHYNLKHYAATELETLTGQRLAYRQDKWLTYLRKLHYPRPATPVQRKAEA